MKYLQFVLLTLGFLLPSLAAISEIPTDKTFENSLGMKFVRIEPGTFTMGSDETPLAASVTEAKEQSDGRQTYIPPTGDYDEKPAHPVEISKPFYLAATEVTNQQYEEFDPRHVHRRGEKGFSIDNDEAVVFVSWDEANAYCQWLSKKEGLPYRLPTEAEWEYACRAGTTTPFWSGDSPPEGSVKNPDNSWYPEPTRGRGREEVVPLTVGKTPANPWGLFDMHGNVEEWCSDWFGPYQAGEQKDPVGRADGDFKVTRGGSHGTFPYFLRSANRLGTVREDRTWLIGFRVALAEAPQTAPLPVPDPPLNQQNVSQEIPKDVRKGPDPNQPYFFGPRPYVHIPEGSEGPLFSHHNHDPGIAECPNGDLLAIWYTTVTERGRELGLCASRLPYGAKEWQPASPLWDAPDRNDHAPALWFDGDTTLYQFVGLATAATWGPLAIVLRTSTDSGATWSKPHLAVPNHGRRNQPIESVFRTREGAILVPCDSAPGSAGGTAIHLSYDNGQTWTDPGGTIQGIHAGVVQLQDGRLMALGRGRPIEGKMPMSLSSDLGASWSYSPSPFPPISGGQRMVLMRLAEGPLFLASFATEPVLVTDASGKQRPIEGLFAAISYDDGKTWPKIRLVSDDGPGREVEAMDGQKFTLDATQAEPKGYLSGCQGREGVIHLISSRQHYAFNLKWIETAPPAHGKN